MDWFGGLATLIVTCVFLIFILFYSLGIVIYSIQLVYSLSDKKEGAWRYWYIIIGNISMILICRHMITYFHSHSDSIDLNIPYLIFLGAIYYLFSSRFFRWKKREDMQDNLTVEDKERM